MHSTMISSIFIITISMIVACWANNLEIKYQWKTIDFNYESDEKRQEAIDKQTFIPNNVIPVGMDIYKDRLFLSFPRLKRGVPASLAYINMTEEAEKQKSSSPDAPVNRPSNDASNSPILKPYPNWAAHQTVNADDISDIVSPFHIKVDRCGRLWAIDTGLDESLEILQEKEPKYLAEPRILIYNLTNDNLIRTHQLPKSTVGNSIYSNIVVDDSNDDCENAFAYVASSGASKPKLIVYSHKANESWPVEHNFFHLEPLAGNFSVLGVDYQTSDSLYGLALTEKKNDGFPVLYFHALTSYREFKVSTAVLRNKELFGTPLGQGKYFKDFVEVGTRATNEQAGASAYDKSQNIIFYTLPNKNEVGCWKTSNKDKYGVENVFSSPGYPFDVKVDDTQHVWILSNNMHQFIRGELSAQNTANFYIHYGLAKELIKDTRCEPGFLDKIKKKLNKNDSYAIQPAAFVTIIALIVLSIKHLF